MQFFKYLFLLKLTFLFCSCHKHDRNITPSIYHWKQDFSPTNYESNVLDKNNISTIYLRYFDVKLIDEKVVPTSTIDFRKTVGRGMNIIPVIYIDNNIFDKTDEDQIGALAEKIINRINDISQKNKINSYSEIQIDCDWTAKTKDKYFNLLTEIKSLIENKSLSVTLRLHQLKYAEKTGIPPADKVTLMYYNMSKVERFDTPNSILDNEEGIKYLTGIKKYPLHVDIALPIFEWGVLFRQKKLIAILSDVNSQNVGLFRNIRPLERNFSAFTNDTVIRNIFVRKGDVLRIESVNFGELSEAAQNCSSIIPDTQTSISVILFSLDSTQLKKYDQGNFIQNIFHSFH